MSTNFVENTSNNLVEKKIKSWSDSLLDLSRRNPSLNFVTHSKTGKKKSSVFQVGVDANKLFDLLVNQGKTVSINELDLSGEVIGQEEDFSSLFEGNNLIKKFTRLKRDAESILEERGTHVLYLTLGMYEWKDEKISNESLNTPLIFIPINIQKIRTKDRFGIQISDMGEIELNPTFSYVLKKLYDLDLDNVILNLTNNNQSENVVTEILNNLESELNKVSNGSLKREIWISKFWFEKLVLFSDMQKNSNIFINNENVRNICGEGKLIDINGTIELEMLKKIAETRKVTDVYEVLDTDSSQRIAIEAAIAGKNFILIGPPGTGKSQTITNIIAECLARGKKVLFVSEKLAALKVVEKKLQEAALSRFCLSVHGKNVKKRDFYSELYSCYEQIINNNPCDGEKINPVYDELLDRKSKLDNYALALKASDPMFKKNTQYIQSKLIEFENTPSIKTKLDIKNIDDLKYKNQKDTLERCLAFKDIILEEVKSDWYLTTLNGPFTRSLHENINSTLKKLKSVDSINNAVEKIKVLFDLEHDIKLNNLQDLRVIINLLISEKLIDKKWLNYSSFLSAQEFLEKDRALHEKILFEREQFLNYFREDLLLEDLEKLKNNFSEQHEGNGFRFFNTNYWNARKNILKYKSRNKKLPLWIKDEVIYEEIERGMKIQNYRKEIITNLESFKNRYGDYYDFENTNWNIISDLISQAEFIFEALKNIGINIHEPLPEKLINILSSLNPHIKNECLQILTELEKPFLLFSNGFEELKNYFPVVHHKEVVAYNKIEIRAKYLLSDIDIGEKTFVEIKDWILKLSYELNSTPSLLERWFYYKNLREKINTLGLSDFLHDISQECPENFGLVVEIFEKRIFELMYMNLEEKYPDISNFNFDEHTRCINDFRNLDIKAVEENKIRLNNLLSINIKEKIITSDEQGIKLVKKLGNQKCPRMPIRIAIKEIGNLFLKLKPCWMMSPLSVSQYCPCEEELFDLVIFDEASQVRPQDAIGAILRAKQIIVVGDPRQLPPTNFFQRITQEDENNIDDADAIEESIIDEIKSKASNFAEIPLRWHYRSKSEDLFSFANENIYSDLKLITFPNPTDFTKDGKILGVRHLLVEDGVYDRGGTRTNQVEADKIAELVIEHFANNPSDKSDKNYTSLGVIAFSAAQEKTIVDALYRKRFKYGFIENILDDRTGEHFFIKNLETVQGDERDHIIISVGYGPDKERKLTGNFGPLNQEGGERRLNVAITRARKSLTLVSSFNHKDITINTNQRGPQLLLKYLKYAEEKGKNLKLNDNDVSEFDSYFDELIFNKIAENKIKLKTKIGSSDCKIGMAVVNPNFENCYLFAIETDGPSYYNNLITRDRERLTRSILEERGWEIHKVWSKEWMKNPISELNKILERYHRIVEEHKQKSEIILSDGVIEFDPLLSESA